MSHCTAKSQGMNEAEAVWPVSWTLGYAAKKENRIQRCSSPITRKSIAMVISLLMHLQKGIIDNMRSCMASNAQERQLQRFDARQSVILLLLYLMAMDFQNRFFYLAFASFGVLALCNRSALQLPRNVVPALILAVSLSALGPSTRNSLLGVLRPLTYPFCVIIGYNLTNSKQMKGKEGQLVTIIAVLAAGAFTHYLLNMALNIDAESDRNTIDVWTHMTRAATGQSALACLMVGVTCATLFCDVQGRIKALCLAIMAAIVAYNLQLAGRTLFFFIVIAMLLAFVIRYQTEKKWTTRLKLIGGAALLLCVVAVLISVNAFGIVDRFQESNFYDRFYGKYSVDMTEDGRLEKKLSYLKYMGDYMFGGGHIREKVGYAHDVILDTYDEAGVFAMLAVICMLCSDLHKCIHLYRNSKVSANTKIIVGTVFVIMLCQMMLEPILLGVQWLMASYCVISGSLGKLYEISKAWE